MSDSPTRWSKRRTLKQLSAGLLIASTPTRLLRAATSLRLRENPFTLGVASGYPGPDTVVLWTRLAPSPQEPGGGLPQDAVIPVDWEIATDEHMRSVVQRGIAYATADWAHSVHIEPGELQPERDYWYRFSAAGLRSPIGRTRTAPAVRTAKSHLRIAVASCQQYEHGYYAAYRHMLNDELDMIVHVGDYIYEISWGDKRVRHHAMPEALSLDDYRARYTQYRSDPDLQAAHARYPWILTWDDHEVENDYTADVSPMDDPASWFLARRAAAYRAYYEHMPLPRRALPFGADMHLYTQRSCGDLANIMMLDSRQYRSRLACTEPARRLSRAVDCSELHESQRTKLGAVQEQWLTGRMANSRARWNVLAQGTVMAYLDEKAGPGELFWNDNWNGYSAARTRLMTAIEQTHLSNPIVLSGDVHAFMVANHHLTPQDRNSKVIASEFVTTSITSQGRAQASLDALRPENPNLLFANSEKRGYLLLDITPERLQADLVALNEVTDRDSGKQVQARFIVENGQAGPIAN